MGEVKQTHPPTAGLHTQYPLGTAFSTVCVLLVLVGYMVGTLCTKGLIECLHMIMLILNKKCENNRCLICGNNTLSVQWASWNIVHLNTDGSSPYDSAH